MADEIVIFVLPFIRRVGAVVCYGISGSKVKGHRHGSVASKGNNCLTAYGLGTVPASVDILFPCAGDL